MLKRDMDLEFEQQQVALSQDNSPVNDVSDIPSGNLKPMLKATRSGRLVKPREILDL